MIDQADKLRQLVRETIKEHTALEPGVPLITVSGARAGVGTSTVAARLAQELTHLGKRVILVDAHIVRPTLAADLNIVSHVGIGEVLNGTRSAVEALEPVANGLQLLPAQSSKAAQPDLHIKALRRLLVELRGLHRTADMVVLDAGQGMYPWIERLWSAALQVLLVTTCEAASIRDAYTSVKLAPWGDIDGKLRLVVNQCDNAATASRVGERFSSTCRQFLGMKLIGAASQVMQTHTPGYRHSVRLLAADVLSHTYAHCYQADRMVPPDTGHSQAASLVSRAEQ